MNNSADGCSESTTANQADGAAAGFSTLGVPKAGATIHRDPATATLAEVAKEGPVAQRGARPASPRRIEITIAGKEEDPKGGESWLAGKILEHVVGLAGDAFLHGKELDAIITIGARSATAKVTA